MSKIPLREIVYGTKGGGTPSRGIPEYWNGGTPWATVKDFKDDVHRIDKTEESISSKGLKFSSSNLIPAGTPIICCRMAVGRIAFAEFPIAINQDLRALFVKDNFDTNYIIQAINSIRDLIKSYSIGSTVNGINIDQLLAFEIYAPPKPEQTKIAEILSTVDKAIEQTEALIAKQQRIKTGLMQDLLTRGIDEHGNLRTEQTHQFKDSPLGRIPVEWEVVNLRDLSTISSGITLGGSHTGPNTIELPYLRVANVQDGYLDLTEVKTIRIPKLAVGKYRLNVGDVLMNEGGDFDKLGRGTVWRGEIEHCIHQNHVFKVRLIPGKLSSDYLAAVSSSPYGKAFFVTASKQSTNLASINSTQLKSFPIPLPAYDEQLRIESLTNQGVTAYESARKQLLKLHSLKTALMQDLLTGKKRVTPLLDKNEKAA